MTSLRGIKKITNVVASVNNNNRPCGMIIILNQVAAFLIARVPARMKRVILNQVAAFLIAHVPARMKRVILIQVAAFLIAHVPARMK